MILFIKYTYAVSCANFQPLLGFQHNNNNNIPVAKMKKNIDIIYYYDGCNNNNYYNAAITGRSKKLHLVL